MANYSLVIDSKFKPYSFDELVKPYMMYGQAYNEQQNQLSDLSVKSNVWKGLVNQQTDPTAYQMYKTYSDDLENKASILAKEGLTPASRKGILDLNSRYSSEITPIENAWKARDDQRKVQEQLLAQDNTLLFSRHASTTSLDKYIKNPELSYIPYSGKLATAKSAQIAGTLAKELKSYGSGKPIDAFTNTFMQNYGFSSSDVFNAINNPKDPHSSKVLNAIVEQVVASSGVANWNDKEALDSVYSAAREGLWSAVGTTEVKPMENFGARASFQSRLEEGRQIRAENRAKAAANATANALAADGNIPMDLVHLLSPGQENLSKIKGVAKETADILGLSTTTGRYAKQSGHIISKVLPSASRGSNQFTRGDIGTATYNAKNANGSNKFSWFTHSGNLISKSAFLKQGASAKDKKILSEKYDKVFSDIKANVPAVNHRWSATTISKGFKAAIVGNGPMTLGALAIKFKDNRKVLENIIPTLANSNDEVPIREVANYDATGKVKYTSKIYHASDFVDSKGTALSAPVYFAAPNPKTDGILMKLKGKTYSIPLNKLGSLYKEAQQLDVPRLAQAQKFKNEAIHKYGQDTYYSSKIGKANEELLNNSGASFIKTMYNALDWSAESPVYKVNTTSGSQNQ